MKTIEHWINGSPAAGISPETAPVFNPATGQEQARVALGSAADVDTAVTAAARPSRPGPSRRSPSAPR